MADIFQGMKLSELLRTILWEVGQVEGTTVTYDKFPRWLIVELLNDRQNEFVYHSQCLKKLALLLVKSGYRTYKLPENCMEGGIIGKPKYYISADSYQELDVRDLKYMDAHYGGWLVDSGGNPMVCYMGETIGNIQTLGVYQTPDADGTDYTLSPDTGVVIGGDIPGAVNDVTGQATSGNATTLNDTAVDFTTLGIISGMAIKNVTDGSEGVILTIAATQIVLTAALSGGTLNTWTAGDSYQILVGEYGVVTSWDSDEQYIFSSEYGVIANITVPAGNIRVDYIPYPTPFPETGGDDQYPEVPRLYHRKYAMGVVADLLRTFHENSREFQRAAFYDNIFNQAAGIGKALKERRPFNEKPTFIRPRIK